MPTLFHHLRFLSLLLAMASAPALVSAQEAGLPAAVDEPWLAQISEQLRVQYLPQGDLELTWGRPGPAESAAWAEVRVVSFPQALAPQMVLRVQATDTTGATTEHSLILRVSVWNIGWVVNEPRQRGEKVYVPSLAERRYDSLRDRNTVQADPDLDLIYTRSLPSGHQLTWRDVARRPLVRRGEFIEVAAIEGPLTVTLRAIALADAGRGELVRVRNPDSRKEFTAQVTAEAQALVRF